MFNKNSGQFSDATNKTVDATYDFLQTSLKSIEKLTEIHLSASKRILDEASQAIKEMSCIESPKEFFEKISKVATDSLDHNTSNYRDVYELFANTQSQLGKIFETYFHNTQQSASEAVENLSQFNPYKSSFANDTLKNWLRNSSNAFDIFNKMASQAKEFSNNIQTATENTVKKASSTKK